MKKIISLIAAAVLLFSFALPCFADAIFTPSAYRNAAPGLIANQIPGYSNAIAYVCSADGKVIYVVTKDDMAIVAYASKSTKNAAARARLDSAYSEILAADSIGDLVPGLGDVSVDFEGDEYVAKAFFDIDVSEAFNAALNSEPGAYVDLTFDTRYKSADQVPTVSYNCGDGWKIIPASDVRFNASNGSVTIRFHEFCPILFLVPDEGQILVTDPTVVSPATMEETSHVWSIVAAAVVLAGAAATVVSFKKRHA